MMKIIRNLFIVVNYLKNCPKYPIKDTEGGILNRENNYFKLRIRWYSASLERVANLSPVTGVGQLESTGQIWFTTHFDK